MQAALGIALLLVVAAAAAQGQNKKLSSQSKPAKLDRQLFSEALLMPYQEHAKRLRDAEQVSPLKSDLFGDSVSLYNGTTEFAVVDIDLPGNNGLPVQLRRRFKVESRKQVEVLGGFGAWDIDVPYMYGTFDAGFKWGVGGNGATNRCSQFWYPKVDSPFELNEVWSGTNMHLPGQGDREVVYVEGTGNPVPSSGGPHRWGTRDLHRLSCKPTTANGYPGEGFIAVDTNGTKYTFDVGIERFGGTLAKAGATHGRTRVYLMASRVEDRHGNWVTYNYSSGKLTSITASDGRQISLTYSGDRIASASAHGRTWTYQYSSSWVGRPEALLLTQVTRPDNSTWKYQYSGPLEPFYPFWDGSGGAVCEESPAPDDEFVLTITHPAGAVGVFNFVYARHYRSGTPANACVGDGSGGYSLAIPDYFDVYSLLDKTISGPGLSAPLQWYYEYDVLGYGRTTLPIPCNGCVDSKGVTVIAPDGSKEVHSFGALYGLNDGRLLGTETRSAAGTALRTTTNQYVTEAEAPSMLFPGNFGLFAGTDDPAAIRNRPVRATTIVQDGVTFSSYVNDFDSYAKPTSTTKSSTLGYSKLELTQYKDDAAKWVIGQVEKLTVNGVEAAHTEYDANVLPWRVKSFGKPRYTLTYNTDGTVATVKDGNNNTTTLSNWKRGLPQLIQYADSTSQAAVVNDAGWITQTTDQNGFSTSYTHDAMGRLASVTYPTGDSTVWNATTQAFAQVGSIEYGIAANHWRQTISTGNARKITYFDALWRPVLTREYDTANQTGTERFQRFAYDHDGRVTFASYPNASSTPTTGTRTTYDVLGRPTTVSQDSELGMLTTTTAYLSGFQTRVTNPRLHATTTSFMAYDQPMTDWPVAIAHPEGAYTDIVRDDFGKPITLTRRNGAGSVASTRRYVYDANQQLCKTIEPETASTVMAYDAAGNLAWSAGGQSLPSPTSCDTGSVPAGAKVLRAYDARNRLQALSFPDGLGDQVWTYTPDGLPQQIVTYNASGYQATNVYAYNKRRLPTSETLTQSGGPTWSLSYGYSGNGHQSTVTHPSGVSVNYAPNALGQATQAGSYATGASYFPNGALKEFTYGNNLKHTLTQNLRGLPERSRDAQGGTVVLDDSYDYDFNGNVAAISDGLSGNRGNRSMSYDGLDRLTATVSPMFSTPAAYNYDVLDNLTRVKINSRDHTYIYGADQRLERITNTVGGATVTMLGYDAQGNLASKSGSTYHFDTGNRLREVIGVEKYRYDGHGRRVEATHPTQGAIYSFYGQDGVLRYQRDERSGKSTDHIYLSGSLVARVTANNPAKPTAAPTLTAPATSGTGSYAVSWTAVSGSTRYELEERINGGEWRLVPGATSTSWGATSKPTGSYGYRARSCNTAGCGPFSNTATVVVSAVPSPPTDAPNLSAPSSSSDGSYTVSWTTVSGATSYQLEEQLNGGGWSQIQNTGATSWNASGKANGSYGYRARGCNSSGCGPYSNTATVVVNVVQPPTGAPSLSAPSSSSDGSYTVSWTTVSGATSYQLEEQVNGGGWSQIQNGGATSWNASGKANGSYGYRARGCNSAGCGPYSNTATVVVNIPQPPASAPSLFAPGLVFEGEPYSVSWSTVATATSYQLEEQFNGGGWYSVYGGGSTEFNVAGRGTGNYGYRVKACNGFGCGPYSSTQTTSVQPGCSFPPCDPAIRDPDDPSKKKSGGEP